MPPRFHLLIAAQFTTALADNALLIVAIAQLQAYGLAGWWTPMLKFGMTVSYVLFAPFVGPLGDAFPKARLMAWMNGVKALGAFALVIGAHPVVAFTIIGLGAAAYAPAKYGLITEIVAPNQLVAANGWLEVSIVCAVLLGTVTGGVLVSPDVLNSSVFSFADAFLHGFPLVRTETLTAPMVALLGIYALAALLNIGVPHSGVRYPSSRIHLMELGADFWRANLVLWRDRDGSASLAVTTIFWGVGATLQFAVLRWASYVLHLPLSQAAYLQGAVAIGVVLGASVAGRTVSLVRAKRVMWVGVVLGLLMPVVASTTELAWAVPMLVLIGAVAGFMVVPLNALLQHRGSLLLSAGRSVAVQGFNENASVLGMLAIYSVLIGLDVPIVLLLGGFGLCIAAAVGLLIYCQRARRLKSTRLEASANE